MATPHGIRSPAEYASDTDDDDADTFVEGRASGFKRGHRQYEADAPASSRGPLLRRVLASGHGVAAFVSRNEDLRWTGDPHPFAGPPGVRLLLAMRGFFGFFGLFSNYYALSYLSLADTSTLFFVSPILVGLMGFIILREPYSLVEFLVGLASLSGTVFIAKPTFLFSLREAAPDVPGHEVTPEERARAVTVVLVGVVFASSISIIIRYIGTRANALHSIAYFSIYSVLVSAIYPLLFHSPPVFRLTARFFALLIPIGVLGFAAQALMTLGLIKEKAGRAALATYSGLLFTLAIEYFLFSHVPDIWSLIGATIIIGGALRIALEHKAHAAASSSSSGAGGAVDVPEGIMQPAAAGGSVPEAQTGRMVGPPAGAGGGGRSGGYDPLAREEEATDASDGMLREHKR
ncbi:hypothetical protein Rhopal_005189-T1 [Rhodotorula paludigena]|uniref:EamA domain-containing protein n=1 Tax=Rhodotorula paludigena TaxID=86838 RepID=A0AAV5GQH7_9BASI|nr:hypothetical protein Rhopal_005189-T1 [Rhodotorula paludigena]